MVNEEMIKNGSVHAGNIEDSKIEDSETENSEIDNSEIKESKIEDSKIEDSETDNSEIDNSEIRESKIEDSEIKDSEQKIPMAAADQSDLEIRRADIEKALRKKFRKDLISRFEKAVVQYELVQEGDRIAVCISGGKDSMLMAKLFQELKRRNKFPFSLVFLSMDPGYLPQNRRLIEENAALLGIPVEFCETRIFDAVYTIEKSPCYLCARMRRGYLYRFAKERGCNKIALGHHYDDVIETILMGMLYSGQYQAMMPKLHSTNFEGMELIRPMYLIREKDIIRWRDHSGLRFLQCACRFTEALAQRGDSDEPSASKRLETKLLIASLAKTIPQVENNLFRATENVVLNKVLGYKINGERHSFLEDY